MHFILVPSECFLQYTARREGVGGGVSLGERVRGAGTWSLTWECRIRWEGRGGNSGGEGVDTCAEKLKFTGHTNGFFKRSCCITFAWLYRVSSKYCSIDS